MDQLSPALQLQASLALGMPAPPQPEPRPPRPNARNDGRDFQKQLEATCAEYHRRRVAYLRKVDAPVRVFWKQEANGTRRQVVVFLQNPWLDFVGTWIARRSRTLLIEAKSTSTHRLPFKKEHGSLSIEQFNSIRTWHLCGAAVAVVWRFGDKCCLYTPAMLLAAEASGAKSLVFESGIPVSYGTGNVMWDFLPVMERYL